MFDFNGAEDFYTYLKNEKKMSENSFLSYRRDMKKFFAYAAENNIDITKCTKDEIEKFISDIKKQKLSESSVARMLCTLRCFFGYLKTKGKICESPVKNIHKSKPKRVLPLVLSGAEIEMISQSLKGGKEKKCRDRAIFEILYSTGMKASELIELKTENVNTDIGFISCGEGDEKRLIPIYAYAARCIKEYTDRVRPKLLNGEKSDYLMLNCDGGKLTRQGLWKIVRSMGKRSGIAKEITPHTIRHTFGADLAASGAKPADIKERMGHTDVAAAHIYEQINRIRVKETGKIEHQRVKMRYTI